MSVTYSDLKFAVIGSGTESGTWGNITNDNFQYAVQQAIGGYAAVTISSTTTTLSYSNTNAAQDFRALFLSCTGTPGAASSLVVPAVQKLYVVKNSITGGYDLTVKIGSSTGTVVPNGKTMLLYANGTDVIAAQDYLASISTSSITASGNATISGDVTISGVVTLGAAPVSYTGATWSVSTTTATITQNAHGFTTSDFITLDFSAVSPSIAPPNGRYQISTASTNSFTVTVASGSGSGSVDIYETERLTLNSDLYTSSSAGTSGQFLTSQGSDRPPQWSTLSSVSGAFSVGGNLSVTGTSTLTGILTVNNNSNIGSAETTLTGCTYAIVSTTATITKTSHGLSNGDSINIVWTASSGSAPPDGTFTITVIDANSFSVTIASGSGSGTAVVYKANIAYLNSQLYDDTESAGTSGWLLSSQGANRPPLWIAGTPSLFNTNTKLTVDSSGNFTSVIPSGSTLLPTYFNRTWVNFDASVNTTTTVTYVQNNGTPGVAGTVLTVTYTSHGLSAGQVLYLNFTTGTSVDGWYTVTSVTNANTIVLTGATSLNTSGNAEIYRRNSYTGGNIHSIFATSSTLGNNFGINFTTDLPDTNYAWFGSVGYNNIGQSAWLGAPDTTLEVNWKSTKFLRVSTFYANAAESTSSPSDVSVVIMR